MIAALAFGGALALRPAVAQAQAPSQDEQHFDAKGKQPSMHTIQLRKGVSATLPFEDKRDFEEAKKGFIAEPHYTQIMADAGHVAWDMGSYKWLLESRDFQSMHPSLLRVAVLNMA
jgi:alkyl sulfatase BDS1-like metallo-beta-lactamase superfamily hydrolase